MISCIATVATALLFGSGEPSDRFKVFVHPISSIALGAFGSVYGKVSTEFKVADVKHIVVEASGYHRLVDRVDKNQYDLYNDHANSLDTTNSLEDMVSVFAGRRSFVGGMPVFLQPSANFGYYRYIDRHEREESTDGLFLGGILYVGGEYEIGSFAWGFDVGGGARLLGRNQFDALKPLVFDVNIFLGYAF